jgi:glutathione synthase/RimK-type ligase-like ATP-grasp enzyme
MRQLAVAAQIGLPTPRTLVTNDPADAAAFAGSGPTIVKAVAEVRVETEGELLVGETFALDDTFLPDSVRPTPVLLQRQIDKVADIRVTAIGRRIFAVRIVIPRDAPLDFRQTKPESCRFDVIALPDAFERGLLAYLDAFGLRFGAFDLAEDREGALWFLECNPAGQWGWLEPFTGLDITGALVDLLLNPAST